MATKDQVLSHLDIVAFYEHSLGVPLPPGSGGWSQNILCPFHEEKTPSFGVNLQDGGFQCFGCGAKGSVFDFYMKKNGCDFKVALTEIAQMAGINETKGAAVESKPTPESPSSKIEIPENLDYLKKRWKKALSTPIPPEGQAYIERRRIGKTCALLREKHMVGWDAKFQGLALPLLDWRQEHFLGIQVIPVDGSPKRFVRGSKARDAFVHIGPPEWMRGGRRLVLAEGVWDAMAVFEADREYAACAILSANFAEKLRRVNRPFVYFHDNDAAGAESVKKLSGVPGVSCADWSKIPASLQAKDPNDLLRAGRADLIRTMVDTAKPIGGTQEPESAEAPQEIAPPPIEKLQISDAELSTASLSPTCIVRDYLFCDVATLAAPGGTGKTTLVLYEMLHIVLGRPLFGLDVVKQGRCLFVTAEDSREILIARLREIMRAMELSAADRRTVMDGILIWDVTGESLKLIEASDGNVVLTPLADDIIKAYGSAPPVMVIFDPVISFGAAESFINDNEQGLVTAARRIVRHLGCCVRLVAHTGKANARGKTLDQYTSRGGSALSDGARMVSVLQSWQPGDERKPPPGCLVSPGASFTVLARPKLSYAPANQPLIWIKRTGWAFEYFIETPISVEAQEKALFDQVERFLASEVAAGHRHNKTSLEGAVPGVKRADARRAIVQLMARGRIVELDLPKEERQGRRKTYLAIPAEFGGIEKKSTGQERHSARPYYSAAYREKLGGRIEPPVLSPFSNSAGDARRNSAELAEWDENFPKEPLDEVEV